MLITFQNNMDSHKHIMIADDDEDDIELLKAAVMDCDVHVEVSVAKNGRVLLDLLGKNFKPDLIVLDLNMPYMNGYECLSNIRRNKKYIRVPIMILSTSHYTKDVEYCLSKGANHYVVKPSNSKDLAGLVKIINSILLK